MTISVINMGPIGCKVSWDPAGRDQFFNEGGVPKENPNRLGSRETPPTYNDCKGWEVGFMNTKPV